MEYKLERKNYQFSFWLEKIFGKKILTPTPFFCQGGWEGWSRFVTGKSKFIDRKIEKKGRFVGLGFRV